MIQSVNFPLSQYCIRPFGSWEALGEKVKALGLDGLEVIADPVHGSRIELRKN